MNTSAEFVADVLDLCEEQGFRTVRLAGRDGYKVFPRDLNKPAVMVYADSWGERGQMNTRSALKRAGLLFPDQFARGARVQPKAQVMAVNGNGHASNGQHAVVATVYVNPFDNARAKINAAMNALSELEEALNLIEQQTKPLQALRDVLRQVSL